jgi:MFS family permease
MRKKKLIEICLGILAFSLAGIIFLVPYLPTGLRVIVNPLLVVLAGLGFVGINMPTLTFLQEVTPLELRGRVFGNMWFLVTVITIFPVLFSGVITEFFGVRTLLTLMAVGIAVVFYLIRKKGNTWIQNSYQ